MEQIFGLDDVAKFLGVRTHRITYALVNNLVEEPRLRLTRRRIFTSADVDRLADHFGVERRAWGSGNRRRGARDAGK